MSQSAVPITLRLLRKGSKNKMDDDVITIFCESDDYDNEYQNYRLRYLDGGSEDRIRHETYLTDEQLDSYLSSLFSLIGEDTEPFQSIQVLAPGFPSVLFDADRVYTVKDHLLTLLPLLTNVYRVY
jgi:hypothetical protein